MQVSETSLERLPRSLSAVYEVKRLCNLTVCFATAADWALLIENCYDFRADGVTFLSCKVTHPFGFEQSGNPLYEFVWVVSECADVQKLTEFMCRMLKLGCIVEFGWSDIEVMR